MLSVFACYPYSAYSCFPLLTFIGDFADAITVIKHTSLSLCFTNESTINSYNFCI